MLVMLEPRDDGSYVPGRVIRASDLVDRLGESNDPQWKTVAVNTAGELVVPNGSIGFRWREGKKAMECRIHCRRYGNRIVVNPARST
ncbi:hypothetical protein ACLB1M_12680 [Escherichia coli]